MPETPYFCAQILSSGRSCCASTCAGQVSMYTKLVSRSEPTGHRADTNPKLRHSYDRHFHPRICLHPSQHRLPARHHPSQHPLLRLLRRVSSSINLPESVSSLGCCGNSLLLSGLSSTKALPSKTSTASNTSQPRTSPAPLPKMLPDDTKPGTISYKLVFGQPVVGN